MNRSIVAGLAFAGLLAGCGSPMREEVPFRALLSARVASAPDYAREDRAAWDAVREAYRRNGYALLWLGEDAPRDHAQRLKEALAHASFDGLDPARYALGDAATVEPLSRRGHVAPQAVVDADLRLSFAAARLAHDLARGVAASDPLDKAWRDDAREPDLAALLARAAGSRAVEGVLRDGAPRHPQYARLREALAQYRALAAAGGWSKLPPMPKKPKAGTSDPAYAALRTRLLATGELEDASGEGTLDAPLQSAIRKFQQTHGLPQSGLPDDATVAALDVGAEARVRQIELNLERWRWLPEELADPRVEVNVPTFELAAIERGAPAVSMRVVAGKTDTPTPIFAATMQTLVFSPYWNVPESILKKEIIPGIEKDPEYLSRKNMEVVRKGQPVDVDEIDPDDKSLRVRQRPGADNALGHVKFLFPNEYDVYLHDTPTRLFARNARNFSHGCVRIEKPYDLALWALAENPEWTPEKIRAAMDAAEEKHVALKRKVPVYILYETVWVDPDGTVRFAKDLYGHDERQAKLMPAMTEVGGANAKLAMP